MRYKATLENVTMTFEVDAPNPQAAGRALHRHFQFNRSGDPLEHTPIRLSPHETECTDAVLCTTVVNSPIDDIEVSEAP